MSVGRLCSRVVATATPEESARVAARRMAEHDVGTLVVVEPDSLSRAVGIVTDRDLAVRCVAGMRDPESTKVGELMSTPVHAIDEDTPIEEALQQMAGAGTRRLVVPHGELRLWRCRRANRLLGVGRDPDPLTSRAGCRRERRYHRRARRG